MSKLNKNNSSKNNSSKINTKPLIKEKYQNLAYIIILVVLVFVFFRKPIFTDAGFEASDNLAHQSLKPYIEQANDDDIFPQWIPYIFGGMPSYGSLMITGDRSWDLVHKIIFGFANIFEEISKDQTARLAFWYSFFAIGVFLLAYSKIKNRHIAFLVAIGAVFSTGIIHWVMIGHNTKPVSLSTLPYLILLLEKNREKFKIIYVVLLAIILHILFESNHVQMIFYVLLAAGLYILFELISRIISKDKPLSVVRAAAILLVAGGLAFSMSADRYLSILEYTPYSVRGSAPLVQKENNQQSESGGNDYDYATMWSFSPQEVITFFVPNYYGFGKLEYSGPATRGQEIMLNTYWSQKPFEDVAPYMGIGIMILAIIGGIYYRKDYFVQFLIALSIFVLILSFGKNLSFLFDLFFYNFPYFNKFRAPSMALALMQFAFPILAGYGLAAILKFQKSPNKTTQKYILGALIGAAGFLIVGFIFGAGFADNYRDWIANGDNQIARQYAQQIPDFTEFVFNQMISDWYITGLIAVLFAGIIYFFVKGKIPVRPFYAILAILLIFDLWRVGYRAMDVKENISERNPFVKTDLIDAIKTDPGKFRIVELPSNNSLFASPNAPAYFGLESAGGYHAAKLRLWQDMMDVADQGSTSDVTNPMLWRLMNVKYLISGQEIGRGLQPAFISKQTGHYLYPNPGYLPRAFFVNSVEVKDKMEILERIKNRDFNPEDVAFLEEKLDIAIDAPDSTANIEITDRGIHHLEIKVKATGNNFIFVSEMYYPESWSAYLDGNEIEIHKTNFGFRGLVVPKGEHVIRMQFRSEAFAKGKSLSIAGNIITFVLLGLGLFLNSKKKQKVADE